MFRTVRRVEFRDTDAAGIVHFSAFFPLMESAEHEMLRSLGLSVMPRSAHDADPNDELAVTWPRVAAACDYLSAARFEDELEIRVAVHKVGHSSVSYTFEFACHGQAVAQGRITAVCCRLDRGKLTKVPIPPAIRAKFAEVAEQES